MITKPIKIANNANSNYAYCHATIRLKNDLEAGFLALGEYLFNIKAREMWRSYWSSWEEFYMELKMSQNVVNKLIQIYETFVLEYQIPKEDIVTAGGWTAIAELLPVVDSKASATEWLSKSKELTREDMRKELKEKKTGKPMKDCHHKDTYIIEICRDCGDRHEIMVDKSVKKLLKSHTFRKEK